MNIQKSTRHSKITGDATEKLVLYFLSKYGFECVYVDHTGIDLIAKNPITKELMGISVKARSRTEGTEGTSLSISNDNFEKIDLACEAFNCKPYFAIVVDENSKIMIFLLSKEKLLSKVSGKSVSNWGMSKKHIEEYKTDKDIKIIELDYKIPVNWY